MPPAIWQGHHSRCIGKTALAVHWAHRAAARFPDGQLHRGTGDHDAAGDAWRTARAILAELDPPAADQIRTRLNRYEQHAAVEALLRPE